MKQEVKQEVKQERQSSSLLLLLLMDKGSKQPPHSHQELHQLTAAADALPVYPETRGGGGA